MTSHYRNLLFGPNVKRAQDVIGSRKAYSRDDVAANEADRLTEREASFIAARDSFYMATIGFNGWPYIQHRGGQRGFVKIITDRRLAFADFRGNRQLISIGNLADDNRVAIFFMDYVQRARLKMLGRVSAIDLTTEPGLAEQLVDPDYGAVVTRGLIIDVEAYDWNCPQHITPRYSIEDIAPGIEKLQNRIVELESQLAQVNVSAQTGVPPV
jgi:predicted pyridoxine 5'-phosphate oxidase superfamily flavin-nucleotide-binding protein